MTKYDPRWIRSFYDDYGEREWERWDRDPIQKIRFQLHLHYLRTYLHIHDRLLEMGAGPGRFTVSGNKLVKKWCKELEPVAQTLTLHRSIHWLFFSVANRLRN